jgi:LysR family transcriptional regulator of gallate degradation
MSIGNGSMNPRDLDHFLAVVEHGSIGRAAEAIGITQSGLTKSIQRLEQEIGAAVFQRLPRGTRPTELGRHLVQHARLVSADLRNARSELQSLSEGLSGTLTIGAGPSWLRRLLPTAIARFVQKRPAVHIRVEGGFNASLKELLKQGELDFIIAACDEMEADPDITVHPLTFDEIGVIARAEHPLVSIPHPTLEDLDAYGWVLPTKDMLQRQRLEALYHLNGKAPPRPVIESNSISFILAMMRSSNFVSFATNSIIDADQVSGIATVNLPEPRWRREAGLMCRRDAALSQCAQALVREIEAVCRELGAN